MAIATSRSIGIKLCKIFGLDPKKVSSISLYVPSDGIVSLDVVQITYQKEMQQLVELLEEYELEKTDRTSEIKGTDSNEFRTFEI